MIWYDNMKQQVFIGGGYIKSSDPKIVQMYDLNKTAWHQLPDTWMKSSDGAIIWIDKFNNNLLFIASIYNDSLEYIDLRDNKWNLVRCRGSHDAAFSDMFGLSQSFDFEEDTLWLAK